MEKQEAPPPPTIYKFMTSPIATSLITYTHNSTDPQTHIHSHCKASPLCSVNLRVRPRHVERCCCQHTCVCAHEGSCVYFLVCICVYGCIRVLVKIPSHVSQVMALLKHVSRTQQCFLHNCGVRMVRLTKRI